MTLEVECHVDMSDAQRRFDLFEHVLNLFPTFVGLLLFIPLVQRLLVFIVTRWVMGGVKVRVGSGPRPRTLTSSLVKDSQ